MLLFFKVALDGVQLCSSCYAQSIGNGVSFSVHIKAIAKIDGSCHLSVIAQKEWLGEHQQAYF